VDNPEITTKYTAERETIRIVPIPSFLPGLIPGNALLASILRSGRITANCDVEQQAEVIGLDFIIRVKLTGSSAPEVEEHSR
jgi:hypothetical protein